MRKIIQNLVDESIAVKKKFVESNLDLIIKGAQKLAQCVDSGHKILIFGNGGSAADSQHIAAEFVNRFKMERQPLAALALTTDTSVITSIGNDYHFDEIFTKQVMALGQKGDIVWGISTSGNSKNVLNGIKTAKEMGIYTLGMAGKGGALVESCDMIYSVVSDTTARIQETHITVSHILCELVEKILFEDKTLLNLC